MLTHADGFSDQSDQGISSFDGTCCGAGVPITTSAIHFSCSDAGETNARPFFAPDWTVTIPDMTRCTDENFAGGHCNYA